MEKKLFRNTRNKLISGVCSGFGEYFNIDISAVRIIWALVSIFKPFVGIVGYLVCALVLPSEKEINYEYSITDYDNKDNNTSFKESSHKDNSNITLGIVLILVGGLLLFKKFFDFIDFSDLWPLILIGGGIYIIIKRNKV